MTGYQCPFCSMIMSISNDTKRTRYPSFESIDITRSTYNNATSEYEKSAIKIDFYKCPNCGEYSIKTRGVGSSVKDVNMLIRPNSQAKKYPEYIPFQIRQDYEESCAILKLSPKASATLSRRCLQGMIRDFWGIHKARLIDEINELQNKIHAAQWKVIDSLRRIGNIGAHMENDINLIVEIDSDEAEKLIKLIENLMENWYISRYEQDKLYSEIIAIDESKQDQKKKTE